MDQKVKRNGSSEKSVTEELLQNAALNLLLR
jgi:hypothetical protein